MPFIKVLMICPEFFPKLGGTEIQALNLSKALQSKGISVHALTRMSIRGSKAEEILQGVSVRRVDYPRIRLIGGIMLNIALAWKIITNYRNFDIFHFHIGGSYMLLPLIVIKLLGKPAILKIAGSWEMDNGILSLEGLIQIITRKLLFRLDAIIALSDKIKERLIVLKYPTKKILSIPNGVNTDEYYPCSHKKYPFKIIFVGRLVNEKGIPVLLHATSKIIQKYPEIRIELIGEGYAKDYLMQMTKDLSISEHVVFRGQMDKVSDVLRDAGIYVQPSINEGLPNSLLEAMACGLPVVVTNVGGMPDVVTDGVEGIIVEPDNADELAAALIKLLDDRDLCNKMGASSQSKILLKYSIDSVSDKYITHYNAILKLNRN